MAVFTLAFAAFTLIIRALPLTNTVALVVAVGSPYVAVAAVVTLILSLIARQVALSLVAVVIVTANLAIQIPWYYFAKPVDVGAYVEIRVLSSNLRKGRADIKPFAELARASADVITVSELTPDWLRRFYFTGIGKDFPYSVLVPAPGAGGIGLWSRYPLVQVSLPDSLGVVIVAARLKIPGVQVEPIAASVHVINALAFNGKAFDEWRSGMTSLKGALSGFADALGRGSAIVAGDFNSTQDLRQFRDLLSGGYRDVVEQAGAGFAPTFPSSRWFPPLITIDHVLTHNARTTSVRTVRVRGSDHRALLATLEIPRNPSTS